MDKATALVLVSAVTFVAPGSANAESAIGPSAHAALAPDAPCVVSVEHMQKISRDDVAALKTSMTAEWQSVLTAPGDLCQKESWSGDAAYWTPESARKVRRMQSEPMSPASASG